VWRTTDITRYIIEIDKDHAVEWILTFDSKGGYELKRVLGSMCVTENFDADGYRVVSTHDE
jgi:hypothetical protein